MNPSNPKKKVLVLATSRKTKGGITAVVLAHEQCDFWREYAVRWIETHTDGSIFKKFYYAVRSFFQVLFLLPFYHLMHIHLSEAPSALRKLPFFLLGKLYGKKIVLHFHSFDPQTTINGKWKRLYRFMFSHANRVVVLSQLWKKWIKEYLHLSMNISILYNPCLFAYPINKAKRENIILYAGALNARKGYADLIQAFALVAKQFPVWRLVFAGSGEIENAKRLAEEVLISDQVTFLGWVTGVEKAKWFEQARIFCLPSYAEGFPTALLDACSYGIPFIVTPVGGIPDIVVHEKNGLLFTPGDISALSDCLKQLIEYPDLQEKLGEAALDLAINKFSLSETNRLIKELYMTIE